MTRACRCLALVLLSLLPLTAQHLTSAQQKLKTFRTVHVYSDTVYLGSDDLRNMVSKRWEIYAWRVEQAPKDSADIWIKVPFSTDPDMDWHESVEAEVHGEATCTLDAKRSFSNSKRSRTMS